MSIQTVGTRFYSPNTTVTFNQSNVEKNPGLTTWLQDAGKTIKLLNSLLEQLSKVETQAAQKKIQADYPSKGLGVTGGASDGVASPISSVKSTASTTQVIESQQTDEQKNIMEAVIKSRSALNGNIAGIYSRSDVEKMFSQMLDGVQKTLGRPLTSTETKQLFDEAAQNLIYDNINRGNNDPRKDNRLGLEGIKNQIIAEWTSPAPEPKPLTPSEEAAIGPAAKQFGMDPDFLRKVIQDINASASKKAGTEVHLAYPDRNIMDIALQISHQAYTTIDNYVNQKAAERLSTLPITPGALNGAEEAAIKKYAAMYGMSEDELRNAVQEIDKKESAEAGETRHLETFQIANIAFRHKIGI